MSEAKNEASELMPLLDCKCGSEAGKIGYMGGRSGKYRVSCMRSTCPAVVEVKGSKQDCADKWNEIQGAI